MRKNNNTKEMTEAWIENRLICWHKQGIYGCHEDFHLLLFMGDYTFFIHLNVFLMFS